MTEIPRDRYGRPLVVPPQGGKPVPYARCTSFVGAIEDTFNLSKWQQRQVAKGLSKRADLAALAAGTDDRGTLDDIVKQAHEAAASSSAANMGTAIHTMTELIDAGLVDVADVPADMRPLIEAYRRLTDGWEHLHIEAFTVYDPFKIGGTPDRISRLPDGRIVIADVKTGSVNYGVGKMASQLAVYARSFLYDLDTHERTEHGADRDLGVIIALPVDPKNGEPRLIDLDLKVGWVGVGLCAEVRAWRARKDIATPHTPTLPDDRDALRELWAARPDLRAAIEAKVAAA